MKKAIAWLLVLALTAAVSIGATLAYLTDTDEDVNVMTLGRVKIDQLEYERIDDEKTEEDATVQEFHDNKLLYPGVYEDGFDFGTEDNYVNWEQIGKEDYTSGIWNPDEINNEVDKMVFVKNKGDYDAYVRSVFAFEAGNYTTLAEFQKMVHLNKNETDWTWEWAETPVTIGESTYFMATATYNKVLEPGALTEISLSQIALDKSATNADVEAFGETYQILVKSQGIQADGFDDPEIALNEGFGEVISNVGTEDAPELGVLPDDVPFENDFPTEGTDLRTALHYLNADPNDDKITANVQTVTFGLNKGYAEEVAGLDGALIDVQQDVDVYAYYKESTGSTKRGAAKTYDLYILANDDIYTPVDSSALFQDMTALTEVNTENLNTGRTENFDDAFRSCSSLQSIDASDWDVSSLKSASRIFRQTTALQSANLSGWNAPKLTSAYQMFAMDAALKNVNITGWNTPTLKDVSYMFYGNSALVSVEGIEDLDVASLTTAAQMFRGCSKLQSIDFSGWNAPDLADVSNMFQQCSALQTADLSNWNVPNLMNTYQMFAKAANLKSVDTTNWRTDSLENMSWIFQECTSLQNVVGINDIDVSNVTTMQGTFYECKSLQSLDLTKWKPSKVTDMYGMFQDCDSMVEFKADTWELDSVTTTYCMFKSCDSLVTVEASNWGMPNNKDLGGMFEICGALETVKSENWTIDAAQTLISTFRLCSKLKNVDTSNWKTGNVTDMTRTFNACLALEYVDVSNWDVSKVTNFNSMFSGAESNSNDMSLKEIDLSNWNPTSATNLNHMFYGCAQLKEIKMNGWYMPDLQTTSHMFADCVSLETIEISDWYTPKWQSMDAMFNQCESVTYLDVSSFDTANVKEFSQAFENCNSLEVIVGLEDWDTSNGTTFYQTFLNCYVLKELDLSSFNTSNSKNFDQFLSGVNGLTKLTLGANFDFDGDGTANRVTLPNPGDIDGQVAKWYNEANGTYYAASNIPEPQPEDDAVTYVAAIPPANP